MKGKDMIAPDKDDTVSEDSQRLKSKGKKKNSSIIIIIIG